MRTIVLIIAAYVALMISYYLLTSNYVRDKERFVNSIQIKSESIEKDLYSIVEYAYFEGQRDALNGDWRIEKIDTCYFWTKSCWDNNRPVVYNPSCNK